MRLKNSEKKLLVLLMTTLTVGSFFNYVFFPIYDAYATLSEQKMGLDKIYKEALSTELSDAQLKTMIREAFDRYELLKIKMPIYSHQEDAILQLTQLSKTRFLNVEQYQFQYSDTAEIKMKAAGDSTENIVEAAPISDVLNEFSKMVKGDSTANIAQYKETVNPEGEGDTKTNAQTNDTADGKSPYDADLNYLNVSMQLSGKYSDFKAFLSDIENYKNTIIITQINIAKDPEKLNEILGTIAISYPYFTDNEVIAPSKEVFKEMPKNSDPFSYTVNTLKTVPNNTTNDANTLGNTSLPVQPESLLPVIPVSPIVENKASNIIESSDFHMNLKPLASDASTTTIGKSPFQYSELYSSNAGEELLSLSIIKKDGQYQYRYANSKEKYPNASDYLPMIPMNGKKMVLAVQSTGRLPSGDRSSVMLQVSNNTDLPLEIYVFNDDKKNPRFKYKKVSGTIKIIKE